MRRPFCGPFGDCGEPSGASSRAVSVSVVATRRPRPNQISDEACRGTKLACPRRIAARTVRPLLAFLGESMTKPIWHKDSFGFWLGVCIYASASAGWLMVHFGLLS
jgi:hypothetical protein